MSRVAVIGAGYVGLTTAACLADLGNDVVVVDVNAEKIDLLLKHQVPFYEPGLTELVRRNAESHRLRFTTSYADAVPGAEYAIIAVSTPEGEGGEADLSYVEAAAGSIADHMTGPLVVVNKSTVPPLTGDMVSEVLRRRTSYRIRSSCARARPSRTSCTPTAWSWAGTIAGRRRRSRSSTSRWKRRS